MLIVFYFHLSFWDSTVMYFMHFCYVQYISCFILCLLYFFFLYASTWMILFAILE